MRTLRAVTVFCGSCAGNDAAYRDAALELGSELAATGRTLVYGGGHVGLMGVLADAVLSGGGRVIGVIPETLMAREVGHRGLSDLRVVSTMHERKALMADLGDAFVALPGGFGTLDELFEAATLNQTRKIQDFPLVLMGKDFWQPLVDFMKTRLIVEKTIDPEDSERILITDSPEEAVARVTSVGMQHLGLTYGPRIKRRWLLWE